MLHTALALLTASLATANPVSTGGSYTSDDAGLGSKMVHTFGVLVSMPLDATSAEAEKWTRTATSCDPSLGWEYQPEGGVRAESPLSAYYTEYGQLCGLKMTIFHVEGPPTGAWHMVTDGYYIPVSRGRGAVASYAAFWGDDETETAEYEMSVSFRGVEDVCANAELPDAIGDRVVINQHTIAVSVPMTMSEADADDWQPSSCMTGMGQHYFKDLTTGSDMSFVTGNLLPITPMYYPPNDPDAKLNGFLFSWPGCQYDSGPNWDNVPAGLCGMTPALFCQNFCNKACSTTPFLSRNTFHDPTTQRYGSYHVFFHGGEDIWDSLTCPGAPRCWGFNPIRNNPLTCRAGRTCPANTATPDAHFSEMSVRGKM